jgi:PAS domain S-box-containing protein
MDGFGRLDPCCTLLRSAHEGISEESPDAHPDGPDRSLPHPVGDRNNPIYTCGKMKQPSKKETEEEEMKPDSSASVDIHNIVTANDTRNLIVLICCLIGIFYGLYFGIHLYHSIPTLAKIDLTIAAALLILGLWSFLQPGLIVQRWTVLLILSMVFLYFFFSGGQSGFGALWSIIIPLASFFLLGYRQGGIFTLSYMAVIGIVWVLFSSNNIPLFPYDIDFLKRLLGVFIAVSIAAATHEFQREKSIKFLLEEIERRNRIEKALLDSQNQLKKAYSIVENIKTGLHIYELKENKLHLEYFNPISEEIIGKKLGDYASHEFGVVFPELKNTGLEELYRQVIRERKEHVFEGEYYDNATRNISYYKVKAFPLSETSLGVAFENITEQKISHSEAQEKIRIITAMFYHSPNNMSIFDEEGTCLFVSNSLKDLYSKGTETLTGKNIMEFLPQDHSEDYNRAMDYMRVTGKPVIRNDRFSLGGKEYFFESSLFPIGKSRNGRTLFCMISIDRTKEEEARKELLLAKEKAEAANIAKSQFLANMSHEIRTPLNGVIGMTQLLMETGLSQTQRKYADVIYQSGESLLAIISNILDFSKIEAGRLDLETREFSFSTLLDSILSMMKMRADQKGILFSYELDDNLPKTAWGAEDGLRQILLNLVNNAVKFTSQGSILLQAKKVSGSNSNFRVRFSVKDTGIGIPKEKQSLLFRKFVQLDGSTTRKFGGTGLGLAISKELALLMDGDIGVNSVPNQGSEFWVEIPFTKTQPHDIPSTPKAKLPETPETIPASRPGSILLAEDNDVNQDVASHMIQKLGYELTAVSNGQEAIELLKKRRFSLVIMDIQMPVMDGLQATTLIRDPHSGTLQPDIPIIAITANVIKEDVERFYKTGINDHLPKPFRIQQLKEKIEKWIIPANEYKLRQSKNPASIEDPSELG